jgi:hypothetical protein
MLKMSREPLSSATSFGCLDKLDGNLAAAAAAAAALKETRLRGRKKKEERVGGGLVGRRKGRIMGREWAASRAAIQGIWYAQKR